MFTVTKAELRIDSLARRRALSATDVEHRSAALAALFFTALLPTIAPPVECIHTFLPIAHQNEVNTWPIIHRLWQELPAVQVAVSVSDLTTSQLSHYRLRPETPLTRNRWGIPEPVGDRLMAVDISTIDLVLVPLLVFDRQGHRVGYGKGYYDRFLADCRPNCLKVGLSLVEPVERIDDLELTDVRLDACLTPERLHSFD